MFEEDLPQFLADFGQPATVNGVAVVGIFDSAYATASVGSIGMSSMQPALTLATASVPAEPEGMPVVVMAQAYVVATHEPDGTGMSRLFLEVA